ncbi:MAG: class I SAM-dependent methyltransferase [Beijerinckiaceae bacterium]|nr:class I SAM-dependent methyltransferase [Beijerinckiaceae bacterium]
MSADYDLVVLKETVEYLKSQVSYLSEELANAKINITALKTAVTKDASEGTVELSQPERHLSILPGTPYSQYAIPLEYQPSRDLQPRWGTLKPPIPELNAWFKTFTHDYEALFDLMRDKVRNLADIPLDFDEANLPLPAWRGVPYCPFDAVTLYTIIQKYRPKRYLEIGSGVTTCYAYKSIKDGGLDTVITSIDPQPRAKIDSICDHIIRDGLETCDLTIFDTLEPNDILFFDGSHRSFMNSDVTVFFIDILPRLKPGVIVHIHDIPLPWDYDTMFVNWYWNEAYMLAVYLMGRKERIVPIAATAFMCRDDAFQSQFERPMLDFGLGNDFWKGGGAMWFTHI